MFPLLFESQYLTIQTLWVFIVLALLVASWLGVKRLKLARVNFNIFIEHGMWFLVSALFFSRLTYFFLHTEIYHPRLNLETLQRFFAIWDQGFSLWGAIFGFFLVLTFRIMKTHEPLWKWYDALIVPLLIGIMVGRIGQFLAGSGYGTPTGLPWGVQYELMTVKYTVPVHPTQLYSFFLIGGMITLKRYLKSHFEFFKREGNSTLFLISCFSFVHFFLDFITGSDTILILELIRISQIGYALAFLGSTALLIYRYFNATPSKKEATETN